MPIRKIDFVTGKYYHVYNRGVDKRTIVLDKYDIMRFLEALAVFNTTDSVGGIYQNFLNNNRNPRRPASRLVEIIAFNILDNHYHLILRQVADNGISKFMHALGTGHAKYFNEKYKRSGSLFQGPFKAKYIDSDEYLNYVVAYVNLNHFIHGFAGFNSDWGMRSSLEQYIKVRSEWKNKYFKCDVDLIRFKFDDNQSYLDDAVGIAKNIKEKRKEDDDSELEG